MKQAIETVVSSLCDLIGTDYPEERVRQNVRIADPRFGDISFACQNLSTEWYSKPPEISSWITKEASFDPANVERVEAMGPFVNIFLNRPNFIQRVLTDIREQGCNYGRSSVGDSKLVLLDYSAPNIGKPLHIGHIRSTIIGDSVINILRKAGFRTHGINYLGDVGLHIGKVIYSYQRYVDEKQLQVEPERELQRLYVRFNEDHEKFVIKHQGTIEKSESTTPEDEDLESIDSPMMKEAKMIVARLEAGDPEARRIYERIHQASMISFERVYNLLGTSFDEIIGQGRFSDPGRKVVERALKIGVAERAEDGAIIVRKLEDHGLPPKVILKSDGTAIYSTQDLGAAFTRFEDHHFDRLLYVVAEEQRTYFNQMFKILDLLGYEWAKDCYHLSFGMIHLADEKMSSRRGNIIFLEDVLQKSIDLAQSVIKDESLSQSERDVIAQAVGIGAIKYMVLGVDPNKNIKFSWDRALNLDANSSPYIQYAYVRACSLMDGKDVEGVDALHLTGNAEFSLVKKLAEYQMIVERAAETLKPNLIANYSNDLARLFTSYYHSQKILDGSKAEASRLFLVDCFRTVVQDSLGLLGIKVPEKM
ncbi:MAG: arginine--tRNA ligase [Candidatus Woesearchaeota archaeon]